MNDKTPPDAFHAPYNFVDADDDLNGKKVPTKSYGAVEAGQSDTGARHDLWLSGYLSGRVLACVHLDTPTVVGGDQTPGDRARQQSAICRPYEIDGRPAIPGSSLRGMIGSLAEMFSQSSLRVLLEDKAYSVRKQGREGLSALGLVRKAPHSDGEYELLPLTLPNLRSSDDAYTLDSTWKKMFEGIPLAHCLSAYVNGYDKNTVTPGSFLARHAPEAYSTARPTYYYARLPELGADDGRSLQVNTRGLYEKHAGNNHFLLGQRTDGEILTEEEYAALTHGREKYTRGILRVLGVEDRENTMPRTKKHEQFVPFVSDARKPIPIPDSVIARFLSIADARHAEDNSLPFVLQGCPDHRVLDGRLFHFDIECDSDEQVRVSEISISSIWRSAIDASTHGFFAAISPDLLPFSKDRDRLTPAELLLGVVDSEKDDGARQGRALASRVAFSDALSDGDVTLLRDVTLKVLASPKPPSPAMYFHPRGARGRYVAKGELSVKEHRPNGRKVYLHHPPEAIKTEPWKSARPRDNAHQKMRVQPMAANQMFYFHVDFDNLSCAELSLLLASLRPGEHYRHRLGLGKSLGLGSVRIDILGVTTIDRKLRYSAEGLDAPRFDQAYRLVSSDAVNCLPSRYAEERAAIAETDRVPGAVSDMPFYDASLIDARTLEMVLAVGDPNNLLPGVSVKPPLTDWQAGAAARNPGAEESELFKWFMENDRDGRQALPGITPGARLPAMRRPPAKKKKRGW